MSFVRAIVKYGVIVSLIPAAGIMFGSGDLQTVRMQDVAAVAGAPPWSDICIPGDLPESGWQRRTCIEYLADRVAYYTGMALAVTAALQTLFFLAMSLWAGHDPFRMARCFGWVSRLFVTLWSLLAIPRFVVITAILTVLLQMVETERPEHPWLQKGFLALILAYVLALTVFQLGAIFRIRRKPEPSGGLGCVVRRDEAPALHGFVERLARKTGLAPPAWLVASIDADFSVTDAPVRLPDHDEPLQGGVMMLSLPLLRVLTAEELAGIVAHELGHMADPVSGTKSDWGPPFAALMAEMDAESTIWTLSANWHLGLLPALFEEAVAETLHRGEANADAAALRVARPEAAVLALLKAVVTEEALADHANINFDRLEKGVVLDNLSIEAADLARKALVEVDPEELAAKIRYEYRGDPIEPSVEQRIGNFGMDLPVAAELLVRRAGRGDPARVGDLTCLEERATRNVHRFQQVMAGEPGPLEPEEVESMAAFMAE